MANSIDLVTKMLPLIDEVYKKEAKSSILEAPAEMVQQTADANVIKIAKLDMVGLGDYDKATGYPDGDVTLSWETHTFDNDRGRRFSVDRMDDQESFGLVSANMVGEFIRRYVVPEVDAYRFAKIASKAGATATATLTSSTVKGAIDTGMVALQEKEVNDGNMVLFMTPTVAGLLSDAIDRTTNNGENAINNVIGSYNGIPIVIVPQTRFYTAVTLNAGATGSAGGYTKTTATGADINFILMDKAASLNITKSTVGKLFTPDQNQSKDAYQFDYRMYHDSFVYENKEDGIYLHQKAAS